MSIEPIESIPEPASDKPRSRSVFDATWASLSRLEPADKNERRIVSGSLLGVCLAIMLTTLSVPHLDQPLKIGLLAIAVATPLLIIDYFFASARPRAGTEDMLLDSFRLASGIIGDGIGVLAVVIGVGAVAWHLYSVAAIVFIITVIVGFFLLVLSSVGIAIAVVWRKMRAKENNKPSSGD